MTEAQKRITKSIGKINSALVAVTRGRELDIRTDVAEKRLQNVLSLLGRIKSASTFTLNIRGGLPGTPAAYMPDTPVPFAPQPFVLPDKARQKERSGNAKTPRGKRNVPARRRRPQRERRRQSCAVPRRGGTGPSWRSGNAPSRKPPGGNGGTPCSPCG